MLFRSESGSALISVNRFTIESFAFRFIVEIKTESVEIYEGESIETKCARVLERGEPITDTAPIIYTAKGDGVLPAYNIRTDRFDIAMDAYDKITRNSAYRDWEIAPKPEDFGNVPNKTDGGSPSNN